ncbi:MAG: hypothetical protein KGL39_52820 [Patescibacteria group bacterium]|nr:hypothetical protein [Patescibacteria group bacterium]
MRKEIVYCELSDIELKVTCWYQQGRKSTDYDTPPESPSIEVESAEIGNVDILPLLSKEQIINLENQIEDAHK